MKMPSRNGLSTEAPCNGAWWIRDCPGKNICRRNPFVPLGLGGSFVHRAGFVCAGSREWLSNPAYETTKAQRHKEYLQEKSLGAFGSWWFICSPQGIRLRGQPGMAVLPRMLNHKGTKTQRTSVEKSLSAFGSWWSICSQQGIRLRGQPGMVVPPIRMSRPDGSDGGPDDKALRNPLQRS